MGILAIQADERIKDVATDEDALQVDFMDGRSIRVPLAWFPKLLNATTAERTNWEVCGGGYGICWPQLDEHLSAEGLLRGAPAPRQRP